VPAGIRPAVSRSVARWTPSAWPEGLRASLPLALPIAAVGVSFGILAAPLLGAITSILMSAVVWSGTAQFAALSILTSGGGMALAASAALLANTRFLPMGFAIAPSMTGGPLRRFFTGAVLADASFVIGHRGGGRFDIKALAWAAPVQYVAWVGGTLAGVAGAAAIGDPSRWGLDVFFPVFYLSLLLPELFPEHALRNRRPIIVAVLAAMITLVLTPIAPSGVPVLVAAAAALIGLRRPRQPAGPANVGDEK
jgi:predicted branched-subunit amino acid permease